MCTHYHLIPKCMILLCESYSDMQILKSLLSFLCVVLAETDDVVHPLLFACETKYPAIVKIGLTSLQKLIQYKAVPQVSKRNICAVVIASI